MRRARGALLVALLCAACGAHKRPSVPSDKLWADGGQAMQDEAWDLAVQDYKQLLEQYPFDPNAEEAEVNIAEAYFNEGRYPEAIAAFGDFERMHPTSDNLAQIEYRRGMAYLAQHRSADRDQVAIKNALDSFRNLAERYPGTPWATRADLRVRECREELAEHDAGIARFYLKRGSLRAAESRLRGLLIDYPETQATAQTPTPTTRSSRRRRPRRRSTSSPRCTPHGTSRRRRTSRSRPSSATTATARSGKTPPPSSSRSTRPRVRTPCRCSSRGRSSTTTSNATAAPARASRRWRSRQRRLSSLPAVTCPC